MTELFPVSSPGHSVLVPAWSGGSWQTLVTQSSQQSSESSFCLAYIVALHCATALALMWFFRADWIRIIRGFFRSLPASARLTLATVPLPAGAVSHPASHREQASGREAADIDAAARSDARLARLSYGNAIVIGSTQILALLAGISRSGITMAGGLWRGLDHEDAARFAFLLATPVILAAGVLKVPSLPGPAGAHIHGQVVVGVIVCAIASYISVRFLVRWFQTRTLTPFALYCLAFGALSILRFR